MVELRIIQKCQVMYQLVLYLKSKNLIHLCAFLENRFYDIFSYPPIFAV